LLKKSGILLTLLSGLFLFSAIELTAQRSINFGVKAGIQSAGMMSDPSLDGRVWGNSAYLFTDYRFGRDFSFAVDFGITQRGFKVSQEETDETGQKIKDVTATSEMTYVSFTPFLNFDIGRRFLRPYVGAGPRLDILATREPGEFEFTSVTVTDETVNSFDRYAFGTSFVAGIKNVPDTGMQVRFEAKYEMDFSDSLSDHPREFKNRVIMFVLGIGF
jgi:opacity protein-like surface antigen